MTRSIVFQLGTVRLEVWISLGALVVLLGGAVEAGAGEQLPSSEADAGSFPVVIQVDASKTVGELKPIWRFFGYDEPNYTYMKDGQKLLGQLRSLSPEPVFIRVHNLLTSGDGQPALKWGSTGVYTEDEQGRPHYNWTILDHIFDTYLERGVRPYVQIGFMPEALSIHPATVQTRVDARWPKLDFHGLGLSAQGL